MSVHRSVAARRLRRRGPAVLVVALVAGLLSLGVGGGGGASAHPGHEEHDGAAAAAAAPVMREGFRDTVVIEGLDYPVAAEQAPDGRVVVLEKSGRVVTYDGFDDTTPTVSLELRREVMNYVDRGALGLALAPDFGATGHLYLLYTYNYRLGDPPSSMPKWVKYRTNGEPYPYYDECPTVDDGCEVSTRLARYTMDPTTDVATQEQVLITDWCQQYFSHSAGALAFGSDGYLYASGGEGARYEGSEPDFGQYGGNPCDDPVTAGDEQGGRLRSQDVRTLDDPTTLSGSVIRVDPATGAPAPGNPLSATPQADTNARRIVAHGFRNPFRLTIRPGTNDLYVGDVGQSQYEEINRVADPTVLRNAGWPCYEGEPKFGAHRGDTPSPKPLCVDLYESGGAAAPFFSYKHSEPTVAGDGCRPDTGSISALAFAQDETFPDAVRGALVFGDYARGCLWYLPAGPGGVPDPAGAALLGPASYPVDLFTGVDGRLHYVDITGSIHRISYDPGKPTAKVAVADGYQPYGRDLPLTVAFTAAGSTDPTQDPLTYSWDLDGDGQFDDRTGADVQWEFDEPENVEVRVQVSDDSGNSDVARLRVYPGTSPPVLSVAAPSATSRWAVGQEIGYAASATDGVGGPALEPSAIDWSFTIEHCRGDDTCHAHQLEDAPDRAEGSFAAIDHELPSYIQARVTATNPRGLTTVATIRLDPADLDLRVGSRPSGFQVIVDGRPRRTDLVQRLIAGARLQVATRAYQWRDGRLWRFSSWTGRRPRVHELVLPRRSGYVHRATFVPVKRRFTLLTRPAGLRASALGRPGRHGFTALVQVGQGVRVTAPRTQVFRGYRYRFVRWSDGGALAHSVTMPQRDTYRRAVYRRIGRA